VSDFILHDEILQSPVFLLNSRHLLFFVAHTSPPSPKVTGSFCRVPSTLLPHHLCIFYSPTCVRLNTVFIKTNLFLG